MGLFDRWKKTENKQSANVSPKQQINNTPPYTLSTSYTSDGCLQIEMIEKNTPKGQFYDTTRLIIKGSSGMKDGKNIDVQNCLVSYYGQSDAIYLGDNGEEFGRRTDYKNVLAGFDANKLMNDYSYAVGVMKDLLNEGRVLKYLNQGLKDNPENPCGMYVGGLDPIERKKYFDPRIGRLSHNSSLMKSKRTELKEAQRQSVMREYADNKAKIDELNKRNEDLKENLGEERE